jgi:hypothetical protein
VIVERKLHPAKHYWQSFCTEERMPVDETDEQIANDSNAMQRVYMS